MTDPSDSTSRHPSAPAPHPGDRPTMRSIYATLRQDIVTLQVKPGERLSENDLAVRFGTSRAPVREALIRLAEDGLIEVRPQRGSYVRPISLKAMHNARFVREALEIAIVRRASEIGLTPETEARFVGLIESQIDAADDPARFTRLDDVFHRTLAEIADQDAVAAIIEREKVHFDRIRFLSLPHVTPVSVLIAQHRAVVEAIGARDPVAAEKTMRVHMAEVLKITRDLTDRFPDLIAADV